MASKRQLDWEVRAYGKQLDEIDIDLLTQVVIMLGRQLAEEAEGDALNSNPDELDT
jgi:hypothetical protein